MRLKVLRKCKKCLWRRKDSNSLVLKASTRNFWQTFHFLLLFFLVGLGWVPAMIRESPEIFEVLEVKCKFNRYLRSVEFLFSRLTSIYQDWEWKKIEGICCFFCLFSDSLKLFRKLPFEKKKEGLRKQSFTCYPDSSCTKIALGLSAPEELEKSLSFIFFSFALTKQAELKAAQWQHLELLSLLHAAALVWRLRALHQFV